MFFCPFFPLLLHVHVLARSTSRYVRSSSSSHQFTSHPGADLANSLPLTSHLLPPNSSHPSHINSRQSSNPALPSTVSPRTSCESSYNHQAQQQTQELPPPPLLRNGGAGGVSPLYASNTMENDVLRYQSFASANGVMAVAVNTTNRTSRSPEYVVYNTQRNSVVSERIITHSDTLNRFRYNQAPGGSNPQHRKPLEDYYKEESSEGEDEYYESEKPRPGVETMIPQDGEQVSVGFCGARVIIGFATAQENKTLLTINKVLVKHRLRSIASKAMPQ